MNFRKVLNIFDKNLERSQFMVIGHGHITINGEITFFYLFSVPDTYF